MANGMDNLIPNSERSPEEVRENGRKGGIASGVVRRRKKDLREACLAILETEITTKSGDKMTGSEAMVAKLFQQAVKGNIKAFEVLRDTAGQKPVDKVVVADVDQSVINEVESIVAGATAAVTSADIDIDDVTDDASSSARDDAPAFPPPAQVAGIVASEQTATKTNKKRATKKKVTTDVSTDDSPFFDLGDDAT